MAWVKKVNRHVAVLIKKTVAGNTQYVKRRPGIITALGASELITARVRHHGETYSNIDRRTNPDEDWTANKYISY